MEDILYDLHVAHELDNMSPDEKVTYNKIMYKNSVLNKYGVTPEEWDSSFTYYCRHTDRLHAIYQNISERLRKDIIIAGGQIHDSDGYNGDTTDVWNTERTFILQAYAPYNLKTFSIKADSTFMKGDRVSVSFDTKFIFQDGMRDLVADMIVTLSNDSVVHQMRHVSMDGSTTITIDDTEELGIKSVKGYFMFYRGMNEQIGTTLRLVVVNNVRMNHVHKDPSEKVNSTPLNSGDSISTSQKDSTLQTIDEVRIEDDNAKPLPLEEAHQRPLRVTAPPRHVKGSAVLAK